MSDSDGGPKRVHPPPKRRRIINPADIPSVPIYSNKVNMSLQLNPPAATLAEMEIADDGGDELVWWQPSQKCNADAVAFSNSEDDEPELTELSKEPEDVLSPSPPTAKVDTPKKISRKTSKMIHELNKQLTVAKSILSQSPEPLGGRGSRFGRRLPFSQRVIIDSSVNDDDLTIVTPAIEAVDPPSLESEGPVAVHEIPLKIRCRTAILKFPVLSTTPLSEVVDQLSLKLKVPPSRILLLRREMELPTHRTASELGLGIADFIDCIVMAADKTADVGNHETSIITVRLQGRDKGSTQEYSIHTEAPLGSILTQYLSSFPKTSRKKVKFHFDGNKVKHSQTPSQLKMEDGDVIEVWT